MTDEELFGYLCNALAADERTAVEAQLTGNPLVATRLSQLRVALAPLEVDREPPLPAPGLALRTISRLAAYLADHPNGTANHSEQSGASELGNQIAAAATLPVPNGDHRLATPAPRKLGRAPRADHDSRQVGGRLRLDLVVACGIGLFACGLLISGIGKVKSRYEMMACESALRTLHAGLTSYADQHDGRYPQVGVGTHSTADSFASILADAGVLPTNYRAACPSNEATEPVSYAYSLGYRTPTGGLAGLRRSGAGEAREHDLLPIAADYPATGVALGSGPLSPHDKTMNVLYAGGNVRPTTSHLIGPEGDDIYRNAYGHVAAGAHAADVVLGRPGDRP